MPRLTSRRPVVVATLVALVAAVVAPLVAPCVAMAGSVRDAAAVTACGHAAPEAPPANEAPPASDAPSRDGTCCLNATLVPVPAAAPTLTVAAAALAAPHAAVWPVATLPARAVERPPPHAVGGVRFGVLRL